MTEISVKAKYFTFNQNNSGGSFVYDERAGIGHFVIVEALDMMHANDRARKIGLYFDGASEYGPDCDCCGDRWYEQWSSESGTDVPMVYNWTPDEYKEKFGAEWGMEKQVFVHYISGQITMY